MLLQDLLHELRNHPGEQLIQPELKPHREAQDLKIREDQDLTNGAVLQAVVEAGEGSDTPKDGDLVFVHVAISSADGTEEYWSSRAEQGGSGQPIAFLLGKGARAPRAWEIALAGMHRGGRVALKVRPSYGFHHPTCKMPAPPGVKTQQMLGFDMTLVSWLPADTVRPCGPDQTLIKRVLQEGDSFESARPPFEVSFHVTMRALAYDGIAETGNVLYTTEPADTPATNHQPLSLTLGEDQLPSGIEEALCQLCRGERSLFLVPASLLQPPSSNCPLPAPPSKSLQIEVVLQLVSITQVRDMTGTGEVTKRRVKEGTGEFPIDCPLHDTTVRIHYRVRGIKDGARGPWEYDTRRRDTPDSTQQSTPGSPAPPLEVDTGCGEAPEAVEMCVKLMVPGEVSLVVAKTPKYAYEGRTDCPEGVQGSDSVEWEVELVSFDKEGHWQVISMEERFAICERVKAKANALVKAGKHSFAKARYERLFRLMDSTRDYENQDEMRRMEAYKVAVLLNLALCDLALGEPASAISWCDKALDYDDKNAKAFFRRGRARSLKGDYEDVEADLQRAAELDPTLQGEVDKEVAANQKRAKAAAAKQKSQFKNFFDRT